MESPRAHLWAGDEQRPARATGELYAMGKPRTAQLHVSRDVLGDLMHAARANGVLAVAAVQQHRYVRPGMVMQRSIVIAPQKKMEVHGHEPVAGHEPPAQHVGIVLAADDLVWRVSNRVTKEAVGEAGKEGFFHSSHQVLAHWSGLFCSDWA